MWESECTVKKKKKVKHDKWYKVIQGDSGVFGGGKKKKNERLEEHRDWRWHKATWLQVVDVRVSECVWVYCLQGLQCIKVTEQVLQHVQPEPQSSATKEKLPSSMDLSLNHMSRQDISPGTFVLTWDTLQCRNVYKQFQSIIIKITDTNNKSPISNLTSVTACCDVC